MYSNYLAQVGKLVYIIGEIETTSAFKKMLDSNNDPKSKFFFKCVDELPVNAYKKIKIDCRRKGILRCDWFNKILDRSPMMIFMVFNYCQPLQNNQKWQDRLSITIRKINKAADILRSSNKEEIILRVIIIISKQAVLQSNQSGNVVEKISTFLKAYERQLSIYQSDQLTKQVNKNKSYWFSMLDKAYERKYKAIYKRKEESFGERRFGCQIKMAIISQIISKNDSYTQYEEAYRSLHFKFVQSMKNKIQPYNFDAIRQLRTLADIVLLRKLIVKINISSNFGSVPDSINNHMKYFNQSTQNDNFFFLHENILWRENFLQNLLEVLHINDHIEIVPKSYFAQLINTTIGFSYRLCKAEKEIAPILNSMDVKGKLIPIENQLYIGSRNYAMGINITDLDVIWTQMNELKDRKKDFVMHGLQTITRYKSLRIFRRHQVNFLNIYLLRFYLADEKFQSIGNIFNEIIRLKINEYDIYSLNYLIEELEKQTQTSEEHKILIHSLAVLIADYFRNQEQLEKYGSLLIRSLPNKVSKSSSIDLLSDSHQIQTTAQENLPQKDPIILPLTSQSNIFSVEAQLPGEIHMIEQPLQIFVTPKFRNQFLSQFNKKAVLKLYFNNPQIQCQNIIDLSNATNQDNKIRININPLQYFSKDENLQLTKAVLILQSNPQIHFLVENIQFTKYKSVLLVTKLKIPQITVNLPYEIYYINELSKFLIEIGSVDKSVKLDINFTVKQDPSCSTEVFRDMSYGLNLVNSNCYQGLSSTQPNILYLKCNKLGTRVLKFSFNVTITQHIGNKQLKDNHIIAKEIGFRVNNLFKTSKVLKESFTGSEIKPHEIPPNKNIIMSYSLRAVETINIQEFGQHKSPKPCFKTKKDINMIKNFIITPEQKMKNIYMFEVKQQQLAKDDKKQMFLISFYIKWNRIDMDLKLGSIDSHQIVNLYNEDDVKISLKSDKVEVEYEQGKTLKKRQKQTLSVKYRNLTNDRINVYSMMENNNDSILRIGSKGNTVDLGPRETKTITFQILPIKSGYFKYPLVRSYFDGIEAKEKTCSSIICVV